LGSLRWGVPFAPPACMETLRPRHSITSDLKAKLGDALLENAANSVARCTAICEAQIEAARREERRRVLEQQNPGSIQQWDASSCGAWTRGFFDGKVEDFSYSSSPGRPLPERDAGSKASSGKQSDAADAELDYGKILSNAFDIKGKIHAALVGNFASDDRKPCKVAYSPEEIITMMKRVLQKIQQEDEAAELTGEGDVSEGQLGMGRRTSSKPPPPGQTRRASRIDAVPAGPGSLRPSAPDTLQMLDSSGPAPTGLGIANGAAGAHVGGVLLTGAGQAVDQALASSPQGSPSRLEMAKQKTAQTLELGRMLEELTADLQSAHIISPSSERVGGLLGNA